MMWQSQNGAPASFRSTKVLAMVETSRSSQGWNQDPAPPPWGPISTADFPASIWSCFLASGVYGATACGLEVQVDRDFGHRLAFDLLFFSGVLARRFVGLGPLGHGLRDTLSVWVTWQVCMSLFPAIDHDDGAAVIGRLVAAWPRLSAGLRQAIMLLIDEVSSR